MGFWNNFANNWSAGNGIKSNYQDSLDEYIHNLIFWAIDGFLNIVRIILSPIAFLLKPLLFPLLRAIISMVTLIVSAALMPVGLVSDLLIRFLIIPPISLILNPFIAAIDALRGKSSIYLKGKRTETDTEEKPQTEKNKPIDSHLPPEPSSAPSRPVNPTVPLELEAVPEVPSAPNSELPEKPKKPILPSQPIHPPQTSAVNRFIKAQDTGWLDRGGNTYNAALEEISGPKHEKKSHWIWYVFPQIKGLGGSNPYEIKDLKEAPDYLKDPILKKRLTDITKAVIHCLMEKKSLRHVFGGDDVKFISSMTLFSFAAKALGDNESLNCFTEALTKGNKGFLDLKTCKEIGHATITDVQTLVESDLQSTAKPSAHK